MELRPHQTAAIEGLRRSVATGHRRPLLQLPTGAGKTYIAARIIERALAKGHRVLFVVDAISLIDQTVRRFFEAGITDIGVIQADHPMTDYAKRVQIGSVQTLARRELPEAGLVIIDEAHRVYTFVTDWMSRPEWQAVTFIGLSATPWAKGLGLIYDDLVSPIAMAELIAQGYLSPFRAFAPATPDLSGVRTVAGDYHEGQLGEVMGAEKLIADVVTTWCEKGENRATLVFAVDRAHAKKLQQRFLDAGIGADYIDAHTELRERREIERRLNAGEIRVVCNVGCLTTGVDWAVGCIVLARPTQSEMLYVQMVGRGLRVNPGIPDCLIFDHAGNSLRLGLVTDIKRDRLDQTKKGERQRAERKPPLPKECGQCSFLMAPKISTCPGCGHKREMRSDIEEAEGELVELGGKRGRKLETPAEKQRWWSGLLWIVQERSYSQGWAAQKFKTRFGVWPRGLSAVPVDPAPEIRSWVRSQDIRWAKAKQKREAAA